MFNANPISALAVEKRSLLRAASIPFRFIMMRVTKHLAESAERGRKELV
ncbi:hypothetical protein [Methylomonas fluvii]|nr:hypothetical protein [Methylomonas fluvii]